jgi:hypothetical protein
VQAFAATEQQDPLLDEFAHCEDWYQAPDQPGLTVVACDQAQLDRFIASGLTDPGAGGALVAGPERHDHSVPSVYWSEDPRVLAKVRVIGSGSQTGVYAAVFGADGVMRTATFAPLMLPKGMPLGVRWRGPAAELFSADGHVLAMAPIASTQGSRFAMLPLPRAVHARRAGDAVVITWLARRRTSYTIESGRDRGAAGTRPVTYVRDGPTGRRRIVVRLPRGDRWVGVRAVRDTTFSRLVATPVR